MKFSARWLRQWLPVDVPIEQLRAQLTNAGLEVDGVEDAAPEFRGVTVAEVYAVRRHPNADKLSVCEVDGGGERLAVVCGAPNVRVGMRTALATVGARLPGGPVRAAVVRGVASRGMLCSAAELGLGADHAGVIDLDSALFERTARNCAPGADLRAALHLDDVCVNLDLTPNRGDCLSIRGLAREAALLNDVAVAAPPSQETVPIRSDAVFPVRLDNARACPRYLGRVIEDVDLSRPTPLWLRERLRRSGLRSIDPAVDVTNYVLLELGQPMHAFDRDQLDRAVFVRDAAPGEKLALLDGRELRFEGECAGGAPPLLIADGRGPLALAGVMGGARSAVTPKTHNLFLECAFFAPEVVAAAARRFGLRTDASHRYERGVDFALPWDAVERATRLLVDIAGGRAGPVSVVESAADLPRRDPLRLRKARLDALVGEELPAERVERILERLELAPAAHGDGAARVWTVTPPSHRFDLAIEEDLVEEVLRVHGYNAVASRLPPAPLPLGRVSAAELTRARLADLLVDLGYSEAVTYSFVAPDKMEALAPGATPLRVRNPVSSDHAVMRANLLPGLLDALGNNLARQARRVRLFEIGQCFTRDRAGAVAAGGAPPKEGGVAQRVVCGGVLFGPREEHSWAHTAAATDFFDAKGDVERVLALGGRAAVFEPADDPVLHPGQAAAVRIGADRVGRIGRLHPRLEAALALPAGVFVFELRVDALLALRPRRHGVVSRQPSVRRDFALVLARDVPAARLEAVARRAAGEVLTGFELFDLYTGAGVAAEEKSVAVGLTLQHPSRTLAATDIDQILRCVLDAFSTELRARLR